MQGKGREIMGLLIYDRGIVKYQLWKLASLFSDNQDVYFNVIFTVIPYFFQLIVSKKSIGQALKVYLNPISVFIFNAKIYFL